MSLFGNIANVIKGTYKTAFDPSGVLFGKKGNPIANAVGGAVSGVEEALGAHKQTEASRIAKQQAADQAKLDAELAAKKAAEEEQARNISSAQRLREIWSLNSPYTRNNTIFTSPLGTIGQPGGGLQSLYRMLLGT